MVKGDRLHPLHGPCHFLDIFATTCCFSRSRKAVAGPESDYKLRSLSTMEAGKNSCMERRHEHKTASRNVRYMAVCV